MHDRSPSPSPSPATPDPTAPLSGSVDPRCAGSVPATVLRRSRPAPRRRFAAALAALADDEGSATAEYAVATMAAVGFAGLLVVILRGDEVRGILTDLIRRALTVAG